MQVEVRLAALESEVKKLRDDNRALTQAYIDLVNQIASANRITEKRMKVLIKDYAGIHNAWRTVAEREVQSQ